jgi:hypothetical protein
MHQCRRRDSVTVELQRLVEKQQQMMLLNWCVNVDIVRLKL